MVLHLPPGVCFGLSNQRRVGRKYHFVIWKVVIDIIMQSFSVEAQKPVPYIDEVGNRSRCTLPWCCFDELRPVAG